MSIGQGIKIGSGLPCGCCLGLIALPIVGLLIIGIVATCVKTSKDTTTVETPTLAPMPEAAPLPLVKVVSWKWWWEDVKTFPSGTVFPATVWAEGDVQNASQKNIQGVSISLEFYDQQGGLLKYKSGTIDTDHSKDMTPIENVMVPGQIRHFTINFDWPYSPANARIFVSASPYPISP